MNQEYNILLAKNRELYFLGLGIFGLLLAISFLLSSQTSFWKGLAISFLMVSVLEIIVGITIIIRSPKEFIMMHQQNSIQIRNYLVQKGFKGGSSPELFLP